MVLLTHCVSGGPGWGRRPLGPPGSPTASSRAGSPEAARASTCWLLTHGGRIAAWREGRAGFATPQGPRLWPARAAPGLRAAAGYRLGVEGVLGRPGRRTLSTGISRRCYQHRLLRVGARALLLEFSSAGRWELLLTPAGSSQRGSPSECGNLRGATHLRLAFGGGGRDGPLSGGDCEAECPGGTAGTEEVTHFPLPELKLVLGVSCLLFRELFGTGRPRTLLEKKENLTP